MARLVIVKSLLKVSIRAENLTNLRSQLPVTMDYLLEEVEKQKYPSFWVFLLTLMT